MRSMRKNISSLLGGRLFSTERHCSSRQFAFNKVKSFVKPETLIQNYQRQFSSRKKFGGKSLYIALVPLSALLFIVWAFVYGGITLQRPSSMPTQSFGNYDGEPRYVSKVERLHNEKRARLYAEMQRLEKEDN